MMQRTGRNDPCRCGSGKKYKHCCGAPETFAPEPAEAHFRLASALQDQGRLQEAIASYRRGLSLQPHHAHGHNNLGTAFQALGELDDAVASYRMAIASDPTSAYFHFNLANALNDQKRLPEAIVAYNSALSLKPDFAVAHYNLGNALKDQGRLPEANACYSRALALKPEYAHAHNNQGWVLQALGRFDDAIGSYRKAISLAPSLSASHHNLGTALAGRGRLEEAAAAYRRALALRPDLAQAHNDLGNALRQLGDVDGALASYQRALALEEAPEFKMSFARCIGSIDFVRVDPALRQLVTRALCEPWARPVDLATAGIRLAKQNPGVTRCIERASSAWPARLAGPELWGSSGPQGALRGAGLAELSQDSLLRSLLENAPVSDVAMERFLTSARSALLDAAIAAPADDNPHDEPAAFYCALARQCLINDFVFSHTDEELGRASALRDRLADALRDGKAAAALWPVAVAAYFPLLSLPSAPALLDRRWPGCVAALLAQHITEPLQERRYRDAMPTLTAVEDDVSRSVRQQYEESPYPRWSKLPPPGRALSLTAYLRSRFPHAPLQPGDTGNGIDLLIAGCGTGRESIELCREFEGARVLAVDLSLASLGYARRKSVELGLKDIEYAHGDILKLGSLGRTFDFISSVGVLHHLSDPVAGLRQLLPLLRPGGFMLLGLYSERARGSVVAARKLIAERGYASNATGIRKCREHLMSLDDGDPMKEVTSFSDFYVASECRDLLFHGQEHRFTLPGIEKFLAGAGLNFVGFIVEPHIGRQYLERFPGDPAGTDLDSWHAFETEYPNTFAGMYVFLAHKPPEGIAKEKRPTQGRP